MMLSEFGDPLAIPNAETGLGSVVPHLGPSAAFLVEGRAAANLEVWTGERRKATQ